MKFLRLFSLFLGTFLVGAIGLTQANAKTEGENAQRHFTAEYRLYVSGLLIGKANLQLSFSPSDYRLSVHIRPSGFGRIAGQSHVISTTRGKIVKGAFAPARMDLSWTSDGEVKSSYMDYRNGAPLKFKSGYAQPDEFKSKNPVDITTVGAGTVDPFLGMLAILDGRPLGAACAGQRKIFDGRRLASLTPAESTHLPPHAHGFDFNRPLVRCSIVWQPIAGYSERSLERASEFPPVETHFGQIGDSGFAAPVNMRGRSRYGRVTVYATRYFSEAPTPPLPFDIVELMNGE